MAKYKVYYKKGSANLVDWITAESEVSAIMQVEAKGATEIKKVEKVSN